MGGDFGVRRRSGGADGLRLRRGRLCRSVGTGGGNGFRLCGGDPVGEVQDLPGGVSVGVGNGPPARAVRVGPGGGVSRLHPALQVRHGVQGGGKLAGETGEGLEKKNEDFAAEVAAQMGAM